MDYQAIKRLGLDHYNIDLELSDELFDPSNNNHIILIHLKKEPNLSCPTCGSLNLESKGTKSTDMKYASAVENNITLKVYRHVYKCLDCTHTFRETNPFSSFGKRITIQKDYQILQALKNPHRTYKEIAKTFNVSVTYVIDLFDHKVSIRTQNMPQVLCIDEVYNRKIGQRSYCCVLYSPQWKKIIDILDNRSKNFLIDYFARIKDKKNIQFISMDLWEGYKEMAKLCLPTAKICADPFHVVEHLQKAFQTIRLQVMRKYEFLKMSGSNEYWLYKKFNKFLLTDIKDKSKMIYVKHSDMHMSIAKIIDIMLSLDSKLKLAYELKEEYRNFNSSATIENAEEWLNELILKFKNANIPEYRKFIKIMTEWHDEIINSFNRINGHRISNGFVERINKDIKDIFSLSFGCSNFERVRNKIMYSLNVDAPILSYRKEKGNKRKGKSRGLYKQKK